MAAIGRPGQTGGGTTQGFYMFGADGTVYNRGNFRGAARMQKFLNRGLVRFWADPPESFQIGEVDGNWSGRHGLRRRIQPQKPLFRRTLTVRLNSIRSRHRSSAPFPRHGHIENNKTRPRSVPVGCRRARPSAREYRYQIAI